MRVGFITYGLDRNPTGIGRYALELLHALAKLPNAPTLVLLTTERHDPFGLWSQFEHYPLPGCHLLPGLMSVGNLVLAQAQQRYHLDLIHDPNGVAPFFALGPQTPRIVTICDAFAYIYPETHNHLDNWRYRWLLPSAARQADQVITISACSQRDLIRHMGLPATQITVTPCAANAQFAPVGAGPARQAILARYGITSPYLLYLGGLNARKNIARLFEAYARLTVRHPGLKLVLGGKRQWQTGEIDATFQRLKLEEHVIFTGYVEDADLPALYSAAEVFVFPSLYEGFGLPPLEAMACGTPVVTSNVSALPEVVGSAALSVDPYDMTALTRAIEQALTDTTLRAELRHKGLAQAARFTWQRTASETFAIYQHVIAANRPDGPQCAPRRSRI